MVQTFGSDGVVQPCVRGFMERFDTAYLNELHELVHCIREGRKSGVKVENGTSVTRIAFAATES